MIKSIRAIFLFFITFNVTYLLGYENYFLQVAKEQLEKIKNTHSEKDISIFGEINQLICDAQVLYDEIIHDFDAGAFLIDENSKSIKKEFIILFDEFADKKTLSLKKLRLFSKKLEMFENNLKKHSLIKSTQEQALFKKIVKFNAFFVMNLVCNPDLFRFNCMNYLEDWFFHRPIEWVHNHKGVTLVVVLAIVSGSVYYYLITCPIQNKNKNLSVEQLRVLKQQGLTCGYHSLYNLKCFQEANGNIEEFVKKANDAAAFDVFLTEARSLLFNGKQLPPDGLSADHIEHVVEHFNLGQHNGIANYFYINQGDAFSSPEARENARDENLRYILNIMPALEHLLAANGNRVCCIMNTGIPSYIPGLPANKQPSMFHYITLEMQRNDNEPQGGISFRVVDSLEGFFGPFNRTSMPMFSYLYLLADGR